MSKADMMKKLGLTEDDFKPKKNDTQERFEELEMQAQEIPQELPSAEERIEILEQAFAEFVEEVLAND